MPRFPVRVSVIVWSLLAATGTTHAQNSSGMPKVVIPTGSRMPVPQGTVRPPDPVTRAVYPWKTHVTSTIFWIGEQPTQNNPTPNCKSSWDVAWSINFGGYDDPAPANRIANHTTGEFRPKWFVPICISRPSSV